MLEYQNLNGERLLKMNNQHVAPDLDKIVEVLKLRGASSIQLLIHDERSC